PPVRSEGYDEEELVASASKLRQSIVAWFDKLKPVERQRLGLHPKANLKPPHFHSSRRVTSDGTMRFGLVVQLIQMENVKVGGVIRELPCGTTLAIDVSGRVRFVISSPAVESRKSEMERMALVSTTSPLGWEIDDPSTDPFAVDYR